MANGEWREWSNHVLAELKRFDKNADQLHLKIDKMDKRFDDYNETLVRNTVSLEEHIKRTNLLENKVGAVEDEILLLKKRHKSSAFSRFFTWIGTEKFRLVMKILILAASAIASYHLGFKGLILSLFE
jgi:hypothetical protein